MYFFLDKTLKVLYNIWCKIKDKKENRMIIKFENGRIIVSDCNFNEDGDIENIEMSGLKQIDESTFEDERTFEVADCYWKIHKLNGIGQYEYGIGVDMNGFYNDLIV